MALKDGEMQVVSMLGTAVLSAALYVPLIWLTKATPTAHVKLGDMDQIEASIAYKKKPMKQPQKKFKAAQPVDKPQGVSHDEKKKPNSCDASHPCPDGESCVQGVCKADKKAKKPPKKDDTDPFAKFKHPTDDDDSPVGKPTVQPGDFNGNEFGWAPETKGHPFWQKLALDIHQNWTIPSILDVKGSPVGCFHITPDGKIADTRFKEKSGSDVLDDSVKRALDAVEKLRNENPIPVPTELLGATSRWICFRFDPQKA